MKFKNFLYKKLFPALGSSFLHGLCKTLSIRSEGEETIESLRGRRELLVFAFWHGRHFVLVHYMGHRGISVVVSPSRDGSMAAVIMKKSGFGLVRGSSNRSPVRALMEAVKQMRKGAHIAFTVDGPKGPPEKVKPGAVYLAKKMNAFLVPVSVNFSRFWELKSWDRYRIPKPFSKAIILFDEPYRISGDLSEAEVGKECQVLEEKLKRLTEKADGYYGTELHKQSIFNRFP